MYLIHYFIQQGCIKLIKSDCKNSFQINSKKKKNSNKCCFINQRILKIMYYGLHKKYEAAQLFSTLIIIVFFFKSAY